MKPWSIIRAVVFAGLLAGTVSAQTIPFNLLVTLPNGNAGTVPNDSTIPLNTTVGTQEQVTVTATYIGNSQATLTTNTTARSYWVQPVHGDIHCGTSVSFESGR